MHTIAALLPPRSSAAPRRAAPSPPFTTLLTITTSVAFRLRNPQMDRRIPPRRGQYFFVRRRNGGTERPDWPAAAITTPPRHAHRRPRGGYLRGSLLLFSPRPAAGNPSSRDPALKTSSFFLSSSSRPSAAPSRPSAPLISFPRCRPTRQPPRQSHRRRTCTLDGGSRAPTRLASSSRRCHPRLRRPGN